MVWVVSVKAIRRVVLDDRKAAREGLWVSGRCLPSGAGDWFTSSIISLVIESHVTRMLTRWPSMLHAVLLSYRWSFDDDVTDIIGCHLTAPVLVSVFHVDAHGVTSAKFWGWPDALLNINHYNHLLNLILSAAVNLFLAQEMELPLCWFCTIPAPI